MNEFGEGVIDSHCHLDFKHFDKDRDAVMSRAREAGVVMMINSGVDLATNRKSLELAKKHDFMRATLGLSPNSLEGLSNQDLQSQLDFIKENAGQAVGIGEAGLDHYRCKDEAARNHQVAGLSEGNRPGQVPRPSAGDPLSGCRAAGPGNGKGSGQGRVPLLWRQHEHHETGSGPRVLHLFGHSRVPLRSASNVWRETFL